MISIFFFTSKISALHKRYLLANVTLHGHPFDCDPFVGRAAGPLKTLVRHLNSLIVCFAAVSHSGPKRSRSGTPPTGLPFCCPLASVRFVLFCFVFSSVRFSTLLFSNTLQPEKGQPRAEREQTSQHDRSCPKTPGRTASPENRCQRGRRYHP